MPRRRGPAPSQWTRCRTTAAADAGLRHPLRACVLVSLAGLVLLAAPAQAQESQPVALRIPAGFQVWNTTLLSGHVEADAVWHDPYVSGARALVFTGGNLTVCPVLAPRSSVLALLAQVRRDCPQGRTFPGASMAFGAGTELRLQGGYQVAAWPRASAVALYGLNETVALLPSDDGLLFAPPANGTRLAPMAREAAVEVAWQGHREWFNGTRYVFLQEGGAMRATAEGIAGSVPGPLELRVRPADRDAVQQALRPFALLDLQALVAGPDTREPRANVSALLHEYGRVPEVASGAVLGRLHGLLGRHTFDGDAALVRAASFRLQRAGLDLAGEHEPLLAVLPQGIALGAAAPAGAPWVVAGVLWGAAALVLAARRRAPRRPAPFRLAWLAGGVLAFLVLDNALHRPAGTSALAQSDLGAPGAALALATFQSCALALAFVAIALPVRLALGRLVPQRWLLPAEAAWAFTWALLPLLFLPSWLAFGSAVARL